MGTLLFVHGIGVRGPDYDRSYELVEEQVKKHLPGVRLESCQWGDTLGAKRPQDLLSIPGYDPSPERRQQRSEAEARDIEATRWRLLYLDPLYEMRSLAALGAAAVAEEVEQAQASPLAQAAEEQGTEAYLGRLRALRFSDDVLKQAWLTGAAAARLQEQALQRLAADPLLDSVLMAPQLDGDIDRRLYLARAYIAAWIVAAEEAGLPTVTGALRDRLYAQAIVALGGAPKGLLDRIGDAVQGVAKQWGTGYLVRRRSAISDTASLLAGDVLLYQLRGAALRAFIRQRIADVKPEHRPVTLLAHSLGGIASFELLNEKEPPSVAGLVTVGSQAPYLYELDALATLRSGDPLPQDFPPWINCFDPNDLLSYVGKALFGQRVRDVAVDSGQPFPQSHSAYWHADALWAALKGFVK
jgi:hypothetical protein